jgi:hypothetical protein
MVPGINTDVSHDGVDYHVQTEDLGAKNPIILTLVYRNGAVVLRDTLEYGQILATEPSASLIKTLMDAQHQRVVRHLAGGEIEADALPSEERTAPSPLRTVEELIEEYLCARRRAKANSAAHREA